MEDLSDDSFEHESSKNINTPQAVIHGTKGGISMQKLMHPEHKYEV